ncbi:hypothetical protein GE061_009261 [Apolygus lucorum]|uniref:Uncharacterized protein n=1 Tax=Apolygus lucorum TaxID=248454 RepID=A0A8S9Y1S6_APOLU|nr:hypothetical protein GE061_009261 [Apolygus lucorum]
MSFLPFLPVFILIFVEPAYAKIGYRGAESLMQIQRVLELSSEIAKAQDVSVSDISTAESKFATKRESYALPNELLLLVKNHLLDLKKLQSSKAEEQNNYVTPAPNELSSTGQVEQGQYQVQYQHPQQYQKYEVPEQQSTQYAVPEYQSQQYTVQQHQPQQYDVPEQQQQYEVPQPQQYAVPEPQQYTVPEQQTHHYATPEQQPQQYIVQQSQPQSYVDSHQQQYTPPEEQEQLQVLKNPDVRYIVPVTHNYASSGYSGASTGYSSASPATGHHVSQVLTPQEHTYQPSVHYQTDPNAHYSIAAQQAIVAQVSHVPQTQTQSKPQQQMFFVGGHPQSGSYTEALIPATPQQFASHQTADSMNHPKAPVQINIHPQSFGVVSGYRGHVSSQPDSYMPLQILINHLAEPMKYSQPGISPPGGPDQPKMPVYHYSPVPSGTLKNEGIPEMRIKSTYTPPNPHSDKYKDYPSSPPSPSSMNSLVPAAAPGGPPSSSAWYSSSSSASSSPSASPTLTSNSDSAQPIDWEDDEFIKYDFGYRVSDQENKVEFGKTESKKDGVTKGSYHVLLPDGRLQVVKYWSDHTGYHTNISYTVPGVDDKA